MDITDTLAPNSDQLDAVDLLGGPRTFTVEKVTRNNAEQPINIHLAEFPRPWRPSKSMRRVLAACWGSDASVYVGRRIKLFCDPDVMFGKDKVGGTRIEALSHIDKARSIPLLVTRGKSQTYTVQPLGSEGASVDWLAEIAAATTLDDLRAVWLKCPKTPEMGAAKDARKAEVEQYQYAGAGLGSDGEGAEL